MDYHCRSAKMICICNKGQMLSKKKETWITILTQVGMQLGNMDYNSNSSGHASVKEQYHYVKELLLPSFDGLKASCSMHKVHDASMVEHL
ncbi:hypothetical protein BS78_K236800 [Paspalum vaginatum]|uniref:Uncharacterized protein n=1 Tax=Paspalum vaginatum TaxID=158149 RepID=A0A9W7XBK7_9POAL|nr:hypothetical protein BS78_K236800 [Paspalum vaginatum]